MRYFLIAGEASGDLHGSKLIESLRAEDPDAEFCFRGGDFMASAAGVAPVAHYRDGAVMGPEDVLAKSGSLLSSLKKCKREISAWRPDAVILIDYPGFNLKIASYCHRKHIRTIYYIAPKTWASRSWRNKRIRKVVDKLYIIFPFEVPYFEKAGVPFVYKGNPLVDIIESHDFKRPAEGRYLAVLPGSRKSEISRTLPVCMDVVDSLGINCLVAGAPSRSEEDYAPYIGSRKNVRLIFGRTYDILKYADAAIVNSGTASLEAALIGTPQLVCWSTGRMSWFYAEHLLHIRKHINYISLGNLILDKQVFREFIQNDFTSSAVLAEAKRLLEDTHYRASMSEDYARIREALGGREAAGEIARSMIETIKQ